MVIGRRRSRCCLRVGELVEANQRLEARVAELERRLSRSSRNSSLPPSQDPPSAPPRPGGKRSGRGRGGQPGHEGRHRRLLPPEQVDEVVEHWPERCRSCAHVFGAPERVDAAEPWRHQVAELPPIAVRVTEHRLHGVCCPECAARTRAELPREVPRSAFGPRLQAAVVTLAVSNRVSRRDTTELAAGAVRRRGLDRVGRRDHPARRGGARRPAHPARAADQVGFGRQHRRDRLEDRRRQPDALGRADQPRPRCSGSRPAATPSRPGRCSASASPGSSARTAGAATTTSTPPSGSSAGPTCSGTSPPTAKAWPSRSSSETAASRSHTTSSPPGTATNTTATGPDCKPRPRRSRTGSARCSSTRPGKARERNTTGSSPRTCSTAGPRSGPSATPDGVEPTNNHAERGLRGAVIYRKLSLGSQSDQGERTIERLLSASVTCRLRKQLALRLPHPGPHRPRPRRPNTRPRITSRA